ncbi:hypothetical protein M0R72_13810 [Candidatus Pacearchaeota archaeon]|jgi:hypothetical protein|nr:hypothetical protein [Candidatus Pacearchaeota archaeon]
MSATRKQIAALIEGEIKSHVTEIAKLKAALNELGSIVITDAMIDAKPPRKPRGYVKPAGK